MHQLIYVLNCFYSIGTRAPGSGNIPTNPTKPEDDDDEGGLSAGAIVGIVLGSIAVIIGLTLIFVKCNREHFPKCNAPPPITRPPYPPEFDFPVHSASVNIPPPPSYDQMMSSFPTASAPSYEHYHKGLH